jgi:NhaA family Na+:H+ antiporter
VPDIQTMKPEQSPSSSLVLTRLFNDFFRSEKFSGVLLIVCTVFSLLMANADWGESYLAFWHQSWGALSLSHWINDGLMAIFFLLVGLEIEREIYIGELSSFQQASFPIVAALGGMLVPAGIHFMFNAGTPTAAGVGIPMATDIAFALGVLSLAGKAVPPALKVFLAALAIIDDLGAIVVIALFYTASLSWIYLLLALLLFGVLYYIGKRGVMHVSIYLAGGVLLWYFLYRSGVHATLSGVLLAFAIPFGKGKEASLSARLQQFLHPVVAYGIVPLFALANTGIIIAPSLLHSLVSVNSLGIMTGLFVGKPLGIFLFSYIAVQLNMAKLPALVQWKHILAAGILGGIGFTMSIFITLLAFPNIATIESAKIAILLASLLAALVGLATFRYLDTKRNS